jgi:chemotaxis protein histidine kinase CheA
MTVDTGAIVADAHMDDGFDDGDMAGVEAFLENLTAADEQRKQPSKGDQERQEAKEEDHSASEDPEESTEGEDAEEGEDDDEKAKEAVDVADDTVLKVKVNGEDVDVTVGELKRLAGQEKALTQKAMEVAEARKTYETSAERASAALQAMLAKANERFKPYAELDYLKLSRTLDEASWDQLRKDALDAQSDVKFLTDQLDGHMKTVQNNQQAEVAKAAKEAIEVLSGPEDKGGIPGWNQALYADLMAFAVAQGLPQHLAYGVTNPAAIRMIHKAMMFDKGKTSAQEKIAQVKQGPTKVAKPAANGTPQRSGKAADALSRLTRSGSDDDAVDAFMATLR